MFNTSYMYFHSSETIYKMGITKRDVVNFFMQLINQIDKILSSIGIRFYPLTKNSVVRGMCCFF